MLVAIAGGVLAWGNGACHSKQNRRAATRSGARMSMLGSDEHDDRHAPARNSAPLCVPDRREQRGLRASNDENQGGVGFADFANFSDTVPVVSSWASASSSSTARGHHDGDRFDSGGCSDSLEAMLEAQVASLGAEGFPDAE